MSVITRIRQLHINVSFGFTCNLNYNYQRPLTRLHRCTGLTRAVHDGVEALTHAVGDGVGAVAHQFDSLAGRALALDRLDEVAGRHRAWQRIWKAKNLR